VDRFEEIFRLATGAGHVLHKEMKSAIKDRTRTLVGAMSVAPKAVGEKEPLYSERMDDS